MNPRRRFFLRGQVTAAAHVARPRPPWSVAEGDFVERCTRCNACVDVCPERILRVGDGGFPEVSFEQRGCTECGACATACVPVALHRVPDATPWAWRPVIGSACLAQRKVECRVCGERCDHAAIRFRPALGGVAQPFVDASRCTGCGACVAPCPTAAITMAGVENHHYPLGRPLPSQGGDI